jgi:phosphate-selective porin OprO/OprP
MNTNKLKSYRWLVPILAGVQLLSSNVMADDTSDTISDLKKQIQALTEKVDSLEQQQQATAAKQQQLAVDEQQTISHYTNAPLVIAGANGFALQSADSNFVLKLHGFAQMDSHYYASAAPAKDSFNIRRMRAIAKGSVYKNYEYYLQTDFASGLSSTTTNNSFLVDAYVNVNYLPEFQVMAGKMKPPLSLEWQPLDEYLWFLERGFPSELVPNRDVGVDVHGDLFDGVVNYAAGIYDGTPDNSSGDAAVSDNDKDVTDRIFFLPFKNTSIVPLRGLGFGVGSSFGIQPGQATPTYATMARQTFYSYNTTVSDGGEHVRLDPQAYYFWGPLGIYGEYVLSDEKYKISGKAPSSANLQNKAWDVVGSYYLTGEESKWGVLPDVKHPFSLNGGGWGAFQLAGRVGQLDLDPASFPVYAKAGSAQNAFSWSLSLNWYLNRNVKCIFEYDNTTFGGGSKTPGTVTGQPEQALQGRLQFAF